VRKRKEKKRKKQQQQQQQKKPVCGYERLRCRGKKAVLGQGLVHKRRAKHEQCISFKVK